MSKIPMPEGVVVIFFRGEHFYPVQLMGAKPAEVEVLDHVKLNPETLRVERMNGELLWERTVQ